MNLKSNACIATALLALTACPGPGPKKAVCEGVVCINGRCVDDQAVAACVCNDGYIKQAGACLQSPVNPQPSVCDNNPCASTGRPKCTALNNVAVCSCADTQVEVGGVCVTKTACTPSPCTLPHQTACEVRNGVAHCLCAEGYAPDGSGCSATPVWDCAAKHSGGTGEDAFEPDECPSLANVLSLGAPQMRTLAPTGDVDWVSVYGEKNHIVKLTLTGAVALYVDLYDTDGLKAIAADHRGNTSAEVRFASPASGTYYVRVKALRTSDEGAYSITAEDIGADDYTSVLAEALEVPAGTSFTGSVQFPGDEDVVRVALPADHLIEVTVGATSTMPIDLLTDSGNVEATLGGGGTGNLTKYQLYSHQEATAYLRARGTQPSSLGAFAATISDLGVDDHGDSAPRATPIIVSGSLTNGQFNRAQDVDAFSFQATTGNIYSFTCNPVGTGSYGCNVVLRNAAGSVLVQDTGSGSNFVTWEATATERLTVFVSEYYGYVGGYSWRFEDLGRDDYGDTVATASTITVGTPVNGRIETLNDVDAFSFTATAGHLYRVACTAGTALGTCTTTVTSPTGASTGAQFLAVAGDYKVLVRGSNYATGTYTFSVTDEGGDDHGNTAATATSLTVGTAQAGNIQFAQDLDFFAFTAVSNHIYRVDCSTSASYICTMTVRDASGTSVGTASYGTAVSLPFRALAAGAYSIQVGAYSSYTGAYTLTVTDLGADDYGDTSATANSSTLGTPYSGSVQFAYDKDVFGFAPVANHLYQVQCTSTSSSVCALAVTDLAGSSLGSASAGTNALVAFRAPTSAFYVAVSGYSTYTGAYTLTVTDLGADDHSDTAVGATPLVASMSTAGSIQVAYDRDVFSFSVAASHIYRVNCTSTASSVCVLSVKDTAGLVVASSSYGSATSALFIAPVGGNWTVEVTGYSTTLGTYAVLLTDTGLDDHADTSVGATSITPGGAVVGGNIQHATDKDVFQFSATPRHIYRATCTSTLTSLCKLTVRDAAGTTLTSAAASSTSNATFLATAAGSVFVEVAAYSSSYTGAYSLQVTDLGVEDHGNTAATATALTAGTLTNGSIELAYDVDVFSFTAVAGNAYRVTCTSSSSNLCALTVKNAAGTSVATAYESTLSTATFKATTAGTFTIETRAYSTYTGTYQVRFDDLGADDHGDTPQTATALTLGVSRAGNLEIPGDADYFSVSLTAGTAYTAAVVSGVSTTVTLFNAAGSQVSSANGTLTYTPSASGTYSLRVMGYSTSNTGTYSITVQ